MQEERKGAEKHRGSTLAVQIPMRSTSIRFFKITDWTGPFNQEVTSKDLTERSRRGDEGERWGSGSSDDYTSPENYRGKVDFEKLTGTKFPL